ncbi:MAG TPA: glycosyltransferase [Bryobacteraceae bacterium]|nr:glycosyltransferase [Bryobacteraceae bacterium]
MKVLWTNTNFLHPTTKGGQIRTLEILRQLSRRHEIHYVAIEDPAHPEAAEQSREYCARAYPFRYRIPRRRSLAFARQLIGNLFSDMPLAVSRFYSPALGEFLRELIRRERFDRAVVDHLAPASYFPDLGRSLFFQHNVETMIWRRHAEHAADPVRRRFFRIQAERMFEFERRACRAAGRIVAVSAVDADIMRKLFGVERITEIPTGVNVEYFAPPDAAPPVADLVFVGSMDWLPNIDGMLWFVREVLPVIRQRRPACSLAIAGRMPPPKIQALATQLPGVRVTGTVPDVRPYLWGSAVSIVPLRIGGGTRLKIYEAMAAGVPVVSTTVGAEGLDVHPPADIRIADTAADFAGQCLALLDDAAARAAMARAAREMVEANFSWEHVAACFSQTLEAAPALS